MQRARMGVAILVGMMVTGCAASSHSPEFAVSRSVFHNPYAAPQIVSAPIDLDNCTSCTKQERVDGFLYLNRPDIALVEDRDTKALTLDEQREQRERYERQHKRNKKHGKYDKYDKRY